MNKLHLQYKKETGKNPEVDLCAEYKDATILRDGRHVGNRVIIETDEIEKYDTPITSDDYNILIIPTKSYIKWLEEKVESLSELNNL